jgi:hypothetical protein
MPFMRHETGRMKLKRHLKPQNQNKKQVVSLITKTGAGLAAGGLLIWGTISFANLQELDRHVAQIAAKFKCICPMNCNLTWGSCHCKEPGGAMEAKALIRTSIKQGLNDEEVMALLKQKYPASAAAATLS